MKARARGRLTLYEPTDLPDGTEVDVIAVGGDDLDDEARRRLHAALSESEDDVLAGRVRPAADVLRDLDGNR
ncbi:MAG TPA: hypothetical protein VEM76_14980 [Anaeromyxobacteraceae bacterium]|nr:hypothetical protein [Anaeromyxobacteraceae bacterium]